MKTKLLIAILLLCLTACTDKKEKFQIEGTVSNADGKYLLLEHNTTKTIQTLDSVKLSSTGSFSFTADRPDYPDFYQLRIEKKTIKFAVDSTEKIQIAADYTKFSNNYTIKGSVESEEIRELTLSAINIQAKINELKTVPQERLASASEELEREIETHKALAAKIILQNPLKTSAYFAVCQRINKLPIFSPYDKKEYGFYAAVATAFSSNMPDYERATEIKNLTLTALKERKTAEKNLQRIEEILNQPKGTIGYIDIALPNRHGREQKLSALEGKIVLIDFSVFEQEKSPERTFLLRDLYSSYHDSGLEIYQISLDKNQLLWEIASENLPWICVRDRAGIHSSYAKTYNIQSLPTVFLMNRHGEIIGRNLPIKKLVAEIEKMIK